MNPQQYIDVVGPSVEKYRAGNRMAAVDGFFSSVFGPDWRAEVSRTVPGGPEQADKDGAALFESDLPSLQEFTEFRDLFHAWLPHTEGDVMPGANHLLHMRHPADAAARLANFLKRHTVAV